MRRALFHTPDGQAAVLFIIFGLGTVFFGLQYNVGTPARMGPGFFPVGLGGLLAIVGLAIAVRTIRSNSPEAMPQVEWRGLIAITAAIVLSAFSLLTFGLIVAIPLLVFVGSLAGRSFRIIQVLITATVLTWSAWVIFILGLGLPIPVWVN